MASPLDTWHAAHIVMQQHGARSRAQAERRADELHEAGDMDGQATWRRILAAIEELRRAKPWAGERVR